MATRAQLEKMFSEKDLKDVFFDYANALRVFEHVEFNKKHQTSNCYRERAIDAALRSGLSFASTGNCVVEMAHRLIRVSCPYGCEGDLVTNQAGGGSSGITLTYYCGKCDCKVDLSLRNEAISVTPKDAR